FHSGGIFAALSESTAGLLEEAAAAARGCGAIVSFDFNFRPSLWATLTNRSAIGKIYREILSHADLVIANDSDVERVFQIELSAAAKTQAERFEAASEWLLREFPQIKIVTSTVRAGEGRRHSLSAAAITRNGTASCAAFEDLETLDRIGSGDSFASG